MLLVLVYLEIIPELSRPILLIASVLLFASICINLLILHLASNPLKQLIATLSHANGEQTSLKQPHANDRKSSRTGLKPAMDFIHTISSESLPKVSTSDAPSGINFADALSANKAGVAFFDKEGTLLFSNTSVPIRKEPGNSRSLHLEFYNELSLLDWIKSCEEKSVNAHKSWARVASKPAGQSDRKLYDIVATYQKGSAIPVVAVFIEKTKEYSPEEDDLNFIAFAAHELRGPITVIRGYLDTLIDEMEGTVTAEQRELFDRLVVSSNRLSSYVNNILNSAKFDQRHLSLHLRETAPADIYDIIADDMALRASSQRRILTVDLPADLPTVAADIASASEVFGNLIDNAIKYSSEGSTVNVGAEVHGEFVEVYVKDHGIGMPANVVGNLFHKFYRSHRSRETVAGTGIGLYISKAIIESHGGTMKVRSIEGEESTFSFTLPIYATVASKLEKDGGNQALIDNRSGSWIKNHGSIRG